MKYLISTIADVVCEEDEEQWERLTYLDRTEPVASAYGLGIELAEFSITENMDECFEDVLPHVEQCAASVTLKTLHAPYNELFPMAIDKKIVDVARDRYDQAWRYSLHFGAEKMIVHANYVEDMYFPAWFITRQTEFWQRFLDEHPEDIVICLENVMERTPELLLEILERVDDPRLRMCLDVGHANLSDVAPIDWLKACAPFISHYHLHNNDGPVKEGHRSLGDLHGPLGRGSIDMLTLLRTAEQLTPDATAAVESNEPEDCARWLTENGFIWL